MGGAPALMFAWPAVLKFRHNLTLGQRTSSPHLAVSVLRGCSACVTELSHVWLPARPHPFVQFADCMHSLKALLTVCMT